jgi:4-amino-4-deoxy-L-arabinose transferase-like glycosyltransferase
MPWPTPDRPRLRVLAWFGVLVLMLMMLGLPPVQRTQEARVLQTAREMLGSGWRGWMIPHLNGEVRLQKPPLAYWLAAVAYKVTGSTSESSGRLPFAITGWFTLLISWWLTKRFFGRRTAFYAGAALLGGWMFARHARLAETDILATCFVTAAVACIWMGREKSRASYNWMALSGAAIGLAILAKGLPAIFAIIFLLGLAAAERDEQILLRWVLSGAPLIAAAIALPWFAYVGSTEGLRTIADEADVARRGGEHAASVLQYVPQTLLAVAPWTALAVLALLLAVRYWKDDVRLRAALVWLAAVLVPLCFGGQRQFHYLFPAMPALAVLTGWLIDQTLDRGLPQWDLARTLFLATAIVVLAGSLALPLVAIRIRGGGVLPIDWLAATLCTIGAATTLYMFRRSRGGDLAPSTFAVASAVGMTVLMQAWAPSLRSADNPRAIADAVRAVGPGPYAFYGENISLPLVFYLGEVMPRLQSPQDLSAAVARQPQLIVVAQTKSGKSPPPMPDGLVRAAEVAAADQTFEVYRSAAHP